MDKSEFLPVLESSSSLKEACDKAGITRKQFYAWLQEDEKFAKSVAHSPVAAELAIDDALFIKALKGDSQAMKLFFERENEPKSYIDRQLEIIRKLNE